MTDALPLDSEERVQFALAIARVGIWEWDLNTDDVTWSTTTAHALGLAADQVPRSGRAFIELVHPEDRRALGEDCDRAIREGTDLAAEFRTITPGGVVRWIYTRGRVAYDAESKPCRLLGVNIDITDRKSFEEQLRVARGQAERLRTLKATMRTVQDIVCNALMSLQLFRMEAEPCVSSQSLEQFDQIISETAVRLQALGDLEQVVEMDMEMGSGIRYESSP